MTEKKPNNLAAELSYLRETAKPRKGGPQANLNPASAVVGSGGVMPTAQDMSELQIGGQSHQPAKTEKELELQKRRQDGAVIDKIEAHFMPKGKDVPPYIIYHLSDGKEPVHVLRPKALQRAQYILQMLDRETGDADVVDIDRDIWFVEETVKACIHSYKMEGKNMHKNSIKAFEQEMKRVKKMYRDRPNDPAKLRRQVRGVG